MAQKIITYILILIIIGGLGWYINKKYLQPSSGAQKTNDLPKYKITPSEDNPPSLIFSTNDGVRQIWSAKLNAEPEIIFTDADENEKLIKVSNLSLLTHEVLAVFGNQSNHISGSLAVINLDSSKKEIIRESYSIPLTWSLSNDGQKIAYTTFSNIEDNYGYTLYLQNRDGSSTRELTNSSSEIKNPIWNNNDLKIAFIQIEGTKSFLKAIDIDNLKIKEIISFDNKIIDWVSWSEDNLVYSLRQLNQDNNGQIGIINQDGNNLKKIIDFDGGKANYIYLDKSYLGYLIAQYDKLSDLAIGQIYFYNLSKEEKTPVQKGVQILGWLSGE